jgi:hypothetical protein
LSGKWTLAAFWPGPNERWIEVGGQGKVWDRHLPEKTTLEIATVNKGQLRLIRSGIPILKILLFVRNRHQRSKKWSIFACRKLRSDPENQRFHRVLVSAPSSTSAFFGTKSSPFFTLMRYRDRVVGTARRFSRSIKALKIKELMMAILVFRAIVLDSS